MDKKLDSSAKKSTAEPALEKGFRSLDVITLAFGSMIGWGWIMLSGKWATDGGMLGAILAFAAGSAFCIVVGMAYSELTPALPSGGAGVSFAMTSMGPFAALIAGLATTLAYLGVSAWEGPSLVAAINYLIPVPELGYLWTIQGTDVYLSTTLLAIAFAVVLVVINIRGAKEAALFQTIVTAGIVLVGLLFLVGSFLFGSVRYTQPLFTTTGGFMSVLLVVPAMFVGFDVIPQAAGEMDVPLKKIPKLLIFSILLAALWYILMILATCLAAPASVRLSGSIPVADVMAYAFGHPFWGGVCIIGALCGIVTSWNGFLFGAARCIYTMANSGLLPAFLGKTHPKYKTPCNAILFCGLVCIGTSFLGMGALTWFINASSFGTVIMYVMVVLSFLVLRVKAPELPRPYQVPQFKLFGVVCIAVMLFFIYLYLPMGPSSLAPVEWGMVLAWFALGIGANLLFRKRT